MAYKKYVPGEYGEDGADLVSGSVFHAQFQPAATEAPDDSSSAAAAPNGSIPFVPIFGNSGEPQYRVDRFDTDNDGQVDTIVISEDRDGDGIADSVAVLHDSDSDGRVDLEIQASDVDGDGNIDTTLIRSDVDRDGSFDIAIQEGDVDGDGVADYRAVAADVDGDGQADYAGIGFDTGNDGRIDVAAATLDVDGDGVGDIVVVGADLDGDGLLSEEPGSADVVESFSSTSLFAGDASDDAEEPGGLAALLDDACFAIGSLVSTPRGAIPIESVTVGDHVVTWCSDRDAPSISQVTRVKTHGQRATVTIKLHGIDAPLQVTPGHRLLSGTEWKRAGVMKTGDHLTTIFGPKQIESVTRSAERVAVMNIVTSRDCTFCVQGVFAHSYSHFPRTREIMSRSVRYLKDMQPWTTCTR